jgi:hypothetical protein
MLRLITSLQSRDFVTQGRICSVVLFPETDVPRARIASKGAHDVTSTADKGISLVFGIRLGY